MVAAPLHQGVCCCLQADKLDFAIRQKNKSDATEALSTVRSKLDEVLAKVL